jgi:hypothetical protein
MCTRNIHEIINNRKVIEWLLEKDNPSVRYWTLMDLKGLDTTSTEVLNTRKKIISYLPVKTILSSKKRVALGYMRKICISQNIPQLPISY